MGDPPLAQQAAPFLLIDIMLKKLTCMMRVAEGINLSERFVPFKNENSFIAITGRPSLVRQSNPEQSVIRHIFSTGR